MPKVTHPPSGVSGHMQFGAAYFGGPRRCVQAPVCRPWSAVSAVLPPAYLLHFFI